MQRTRLLHFHNCKVNVLINYSSKVNQFKYRSFHCTRNLWDNDEKKDTSTNGASIFAANSVIPGIVASIGVACVGFGAADIIGPLMLQLQGIEGVTKSPLSGIPVSIIAGLILRNFILPNFVDADKLAKQLQPGLKLASATILRAGIVCVGLKLSGADLLSNASVAVPAVMCSISVGLFSGYSLSKLAGLPRKMGYLIAAGTSICGVTAITALAPVINADERDVAFAIATVVAFGTTAMLTYPYLAHATMDNSQAIGLFLGCAIHDTSQVIGSALTYSQVYGDEEVLKVAAITKLTRNLALAFVIPVLAWKNNLDEIADQKLANNNNKDIDEQLNKSLGLKDMIKFFPPFVGGFIAMAALRTIGDTSILHSDSSLAFNILTSDQWSQLTTFVGSDLGGTYMLGTAMAAVGLSTNIKSLSGVGVAPFAVGGGAALCVGTTGFAMANLLI